MLAPTRPVGGQIACRRLAGSCHIYAGNRECVSFEQLAMSFVPRLGQPGPAPARRPEPMRWHAAVSREIEGSESKVCGTEPDFGGHGRIAKDLFISQFGGNFGKGRKEKDRGVLFAPPGQVISEWATKRWAV